MSRFSARTSKSNSPSQAIEDSKRKSSLLKDNSWIRKPDDEDEAVDRDPNFGKSLLSRYKSSETLVSSEGEEVKTTKTVTPSTSVHALTKRFSGSQDELNTSTLPSSKSPSSYTRSTTTSKTTVTEVPKTSTTTTTTTKDGKTTETTVTTTRSDRSPVDKTPPKTESFSERVKSSSKGLNSNYSPTRTTTVTETTVTNNKDVEDKLYDTLIPSPIKGDLSPTDSKTTVTTTETVVVKSSPDIDIEDELYDTVFPKFIKDDVTESKTSISSTETVTVKSSTNGDGIKTTTTTRTSSKAEDELYDTLLPKAITSNPSSPVSYSSYTDDSPTTRTIRTTSYTPSYTASNQPRYEYTSITSPTSYTPSSYRKSSRSDDILMDPVYSTSSMKSVYASPERTVLEKDLCTYCRKPFTGDAKMVLDDLKINCHASCFRCEVCSSTLGHLKAGDSMWIYKRMVHCENCFEVTREKWRR